MIDQAKVKAFWDARAERLQSVPYESVANLEEDPQFLKMKIELETEKVFRWLGRIQGKSILDLGAGVGQWSFRFCERGARHVTAVEYSESLAEIGRKEAKARNFANIEFVVSPAERFAGQDRYDVLFISGLFVYMNDDQVGLLMKNLPLFCNSETKVILRDGTGIRNRHEIDNRHSAHLNALYSATYRTADQYIAQFRDAGFEVLRHENMFDEGCPLNKYEETRLRIYEFKRS